MIYQLNKCGVRIFSVFFAGKIIKTVYLVGRNALVLVNLSFDGMAYCVYNQPTGIIKERVFFLCSVHVLVVKMGYRSTSSRHVVKICCGLQEIEYMGVRKFVSQLSEQK